MDAKKLFSWIFLFIFFMKMVIAAAPFISDKLEADCLNAVIMQVEIEQESSKEEVKLKSAKEYMHGYHSFTFSNSSSLVNVQLSALHLERHQQTFYPSVPTPPPNA
ncbi:MAG TPA: hypothetical protein VGD90_00440 [Sphingobacteriaceae bacterium]